MKTKLVMALAAAAATAFASAAQAKDCKVIAAVGSGFNQTLAEIMANGGVKTLIDSRDMTGVGPTKMKCKNDGGLVECHAQRKACK